MLKENRELRNTIEVKEKEINLIQFNFKNQVSDLTNEINTMISKNQKLQT